MTRSKFRKIFIKPVKRFSRSQSGLITAVLAIIAVVGLFKIYASPPVYYDNWGYWGPRIKACESGDYNEHHRGPGGATGAWQIQDQTWNHYAGYTRAYTAPPEVQDAKALQLFLTRGTQPWDASYLCWRNGGIVPIGRSSVSPPTPPSNAAPVGAVDGADCQIRGWSFDPSYPDASDYVVITIDNVLADTPQAANDRPDINQNAHVGGKHGFNWPVAGRWRDGVAHTYQVQALDTTDSNQRPVLGRGNFTCIPAKLGDGAGLGGSYFNSSDLSGVPKLQRIDKTVNFDWGGKSPAAGISADKFSVRWTGRILAQYSEQYVIKTVADDGVRVYIGDVLVINDWHDHSAKTDSGAITLTAGQLYDIRVEYYDDRGLSSMKLLWSSYSTPEQVIPSNQLYSLPDFRP